MTPAPCGFSLPQFLAMVFQDLLTNKDDYLRASRALLREIIKQTKHEINFQAFCLGLMQERKEPQYLEMEFKVPWALLTTSHSAVSWPRQDYLDNRDGHVPGLCADMGSVVHTLSVRSAVSFHPS